MKYQGQTFMTDNDLKVNMLGFWPRLEIQNPALQEQVGEFLGGDEVVAYAQHLVSSGMDFAAVEAQILEDIQNPKKGELKDIVFNKTVTGIGRGHSLGGLSGVVLGLNGTKMLDSGLTGFVASRSLATSSRRRETTTGEIVVPESLKGREDLLNEYLEISRDVFKVSAQFKERFGKLGGVQTFNKVIPYNNPADIFMVMPLDTMATLAFEVKQDAINPKGNFIPRELVQLAEMAPEIMEKARLDTMYNQRVKVPRDTYLHYTVFKDPSSPNYALELAEEKNMHQNPLVDGFSKDFTDGFYEVLARLENDFKATREITDPNELAERSMENMLAIRSFAGEYNEAVGFKIVDSLSWRVWSEQKRHATLRQNVESVYGAAERAGEIVKGLWPQVQRANDTGEIDKGLYEKLESAIIIDPKLKENPELGIPYIYHSVKQLMFHQKLLEEGIEPRDALYIVPKNIRVRTLENYDLVNLVDLELPLRLCKTCEPERYATSWKKRDMIAEILPELDFLLQPKCNIGFCTEDPYCHHIGDLRDGYDRDLHKQTKQAMLS